MDGLGYLAGALLAARLVAWLLERAGIIPTTRVEIKGRRRPPPGRRHRRRYYVTHGYGRRRHRR